MHASFQRFSDGHSGRRDCFEFERLIRSLGVCGYSCQWPPGRECRVSSRGKISTMQCFYSVYTPSSSRSGPWVVLTTAFACFFCLSAFPSLSHFLRASRLTLMVSGPRLSCSRVSRIGTHLESIFSRAQRSYWQLLGADE